jgi:LysR family transcriptional regulator, low CO2-responsive transcriptional regulator
MNPGELLEADALRSFGVFARHRNFTKAAAELHISQPSLHVKIRKLAGSLGVELYERHGRALTLTSAGEQLAAFAAESRRRLDDFLGGFDDLGAPLTVAAGRGAFRWVIADAIRRVTATGRGVQVLTADRDAALAALAAGAVDLAAIAHDPPPRRYDSHTVASYPQVLMIGDGHRLASRASVRLADLDGLDLVVPPAGRPHRRVLERALLDAGVTWRPAAEVDGWDLLVHFTAMGIGAAVVNGCVPAPAGVAAVPISDLPRVRYWAVWRRPRRAVVTDLLAELTT